MNRNKKRKNFRLIQGGAKECPEREDPLGSAESMFFSQTSAAELCEGLQFILNQLELRGYKVFDFDDDKRILRQFQIIRGKIFFLATGEDE